MSEQEFENWLSLLAGLLQLSPEQRKSISNELRSHLEERMEDLIDAGSSRHEAIAIALEEFGDTAALAHHFTSNVHQQRRRLMRYTYGTIAAVTCAILVLATFWPQQDGQVMQNVVAQSEPGEEGTTFAGLVTPEKQPKSPFADSREKIEAMLAEPWEAAFFDTPLQDVLDDLKKQKRISILLDPFVIDEIDTGSPINVSVGPNTLSGKTLLRDIILGPLGLTYMIRDNFLLVTTLEEFMASDRYEVVVYNCRDLLAGMPNKLPVEGTVRSYPGGQGATYNEQIKPPKEAKDDSSGTDSGGGGSAAPGAVPQIPPQLVVTGLAAREKQLMKVIQTALRSGDSPWDDGSSGNDDETLGSIEAINGLLVIRQTPQMHDKVEQLLELMREATKQGNWPSHVQDWPDYELRLPLSIGGAAGGGAGGGGFF